MKYSPRAHMDMLAAAEDARTASPQLRLGQALFNLAADLDPDRAMQLAGTIFDPFYDDARIDAFIRKFLA